MALLIQLVVILLVVGMILWCVQRIPGLPDPVKVAAEILVVLFCALALLNRSGLLTI